jgi:hypothetical protein
LSMGDERVQEAKAQYLIKQFKLTTFKDGKGTDDFAVRIDSLAVELRSLREKMEECVVKKMLCVVPTRYKQVVCSIEMFGDLKTMSVGEIVRRLHEVEERYDIVKAIVDGVECLLLMVEAVGGASVSSTPAARSPRVKAMTNTTTTRKATTTIATAQTRGASVARVATEGNALSMASTTTGPSIAM